MICFLWSLFLNYRANNPNRDNKTIYEALPFLYESMGIQKSENYTSEVLGETWSNFSLLFPSPRPFCF